MPSLRELQQRFGRALLEGPDIFAAEVAGGAITAGDRLQIYANNARAMFAGALALTYPVLRRRVGDDFFRQLGREYRAVHPSRSGDLHWVGQHFPAFLEGRLGDGEYAWLADLARLEWACEEALVAADDESIGVASLADASPQDLERVVLTLTASARFVESSFPVLAVWEANQPDQPGTQVDLACGGENVLVRAAPAGLELRRLPPVEFDFVRRLGSGETLGSALDQSGMAIESVAATLSWLFGEGYVVAVAVAEPRQG